MIPEQKVRVSQVYRALLAEMQETERQAAEDCEPEGMRWIDGYRQGIQRALEIFREVI